MKRALLIVGLTFSIISLSACGKKASDYKETSEETIAEEIDVDETLKKLTDSEGYKECDFDQKRQAAEIILSNLESNNKIDNLNYDESNNKFTFDYDSKHHGEFIVEKNFKK